MRPLFGTNDSKIARRSIKGSVRRSWPSFSKTSKATYAIGTEGFGHFDPPPQHLVLLIERKARMKVHRFAVSRSWSALPIHFEQRAGNIGHAQTVFLQNALRFCDFLRIKVNDVLVPHRTQFNPSHPEFARRNLAGMAKILADLIIDNGNAERRCRFRQRVAGRRNYNRCGTHRPHSRQEFTTRN